MVLLKWKQVADKPKFLNFFGTLFCKYKYKLQIKKFTFSCRKIFFDQMLEFCDWNECLRSNLKFRGQKPDLHQYSAKLGICQNTRIQTDTMHTYTYMIKMILDLLNWSCGSLSIRVCLGVQSCPSILKMKADYFLNFCLLWMRPLCVFVCGCRKC